METQPRSVVRSSVNEAAEALGGVGADGEQPDVVDHDQFDRRMGVNPLAMVSSTRWRRITAPRSSMENQATVWPVPMA